MDSFRPACLVFLVAWLTAVTSFTQEKAKTPRKLEAVTLGVSAKHVLNLPIYMAQKYGILESEGIDLRLITAKTSTIIAALVAGEMDYVTSFNSGLAAAVAGAPLTAVYVTTDKSLLYLISRPDVVDAKSLRGGIIGHGGTRGAHYHASVAMVKHLGLNPEKDVQLISTIDVTQGMTALFSGRVAATTLSPPYDSMAVRKGYHRLVSGPDVLAKFIENGLVTGKTKVRDHPDQVRRMLRALVKGLQYTLANSNEAVALVQKEWNLDRDAAKIAYEAVAPTYNLRGEVSDEIVAASIKRALQDAKIGQSDFAPKDFVNWGSIRDVQRELRR
jgi:ABC-type nitrate/sulfonate/bicarbonate transport system substrate-binding protein